MEDQSELSKRLLEVLEGLGSVRLSAAQSLGAPVPALEANLPPPAMPEGLDAYPNQPLPAPKLTPEQKAWVATMEPNAVDLRRAMSEAGRTGAALYDYVASDTLMRMLRPFRADVAPDVPPEKLLAYYLVSNMEVIQKTQPTWSATQASMYAFYVTMLGGPWAPAGAGAMTAQFTEGPPEILGETMRQRGADLMDVTMPSEDMPLMTGQSVNPTVEGAVTALAKVIMTYVGLVTTHLGNATTARIRKFNDALAHAGLIKVAATPDAVQAAWTCTRRLACSGELDITAIRFVSGYLSRTTERLRNFSRQSLFRTIGPLTVTAFLMGAYPEVGWRTLAGMYPGETTAFLSAITLVVEHQEDVVYRRPIELAQAKYLHIVASAIGLARQAYPSLMALRRKYRSAKLGPHVHQWLRDNAGRIHMGSYGNVSDDIAQRMSDLSSMLSMALAMDP